MITIGDNQTKQPLPRQIEKLFAQRSISVPVGKIPLADVDRALTGLPVEERLHIKCRLRELGRLA